MLKHTTLPHYLINRPTRSAKWDYGHCLLIAGHYGGMGCAILASRAALRVGAGLLTAHVPRLGVDAMQVATPEVMLDVDPDAQIFTQLGCPLSRFQAIGVGPGIGTAEHTREALLQLLRAIPEETPLVLDADALNILARSPEALHALRPHSAILTPHVREMARLGGHPEQFAEQYGVTVVMKGAPTAVYSPGGRNTLIFTGNPGMATAGSGDVLTGILLGLASQNILCARDLQYTLHDLAVLGVKIHGKSGEFYAKNHPECTLIASDLVKNIPNAIADLSIG